MNPEIKKAFEKYREEQIIWTYDELEKRKLVYTNNLWSPNTLSLKNSTLEEQSINIITKYLYFHEFEDIPVIWNAVKGLYKPGTTVFLTKGEEKTSLVNEIIKSMGGGNTDEANSEIYFIKELLIEYEDGRRKHEILEEETHILEKRLLQIKAEGFTKASKNLYNNTIGHGVDGVVKKSTGFLSRFFK